MTLKEAAETLKVAAAEVEWEYPINYSAALLIAAKSIEEWEKLAEEVQKLPMNQSPKFLSAYPGYTSGVADSLQMIREAKERVENNT